MGAATDPPFMLLWNFELDKLEGHGEEGIRKLTRMLVALDFYGIESSLAGSIVFKLYTTMNQEPGLACAVLDEFGHDGVEMKDEQRNLIVKAVGRAMMLLRNTPLPMLLPNSSDAIVGGIACIQDTRTVSKLLSELQLMPHIKAQTEFQVLDAWASSASNSTEAANKLLEESGVLARFVKEDPAVFSDPVGIVFKSSWIKSTELALDALHKHVCSVKTKESSSRKASPSQSAKTFERAPSVVLDSRRMVNARNCFGKNSSPRARRPSLY